MTLSRRDFLKAVATAAATVTALEGLSYASGSNEVSAASGNFVTSANDVIVPGVCLLCSSGCGILARVADGNVVKLEGNPMHPVNLGALCPKGQAAPELPYTPARLSGPMQRVGERGAGKWEEISWDQAARTVADRLNELRN